MNKITNILVPYDGSSCSKHTFDLALDMAQKYDSKLTLITYIEKINGSWFGHERSTAYLKKVGKYEEAIQKEIKN